MNLGIENLESKYCVVLTTYNKEEIGKKIIDALLLNKLAACIQVSNLKSYYNWKGNINCDDENLLIIKTKTILYNDVEQVIRDNHNYELPEIIVLPISNGFSDYLSWIDSECR